MAAVQSTGSAPVSQAGSFPLRSLSGQQAARSDAVVSELTDMRVLVRRLKKILHGACRLRSAMLTRHGLPAPANPPGAPDLSGASRHGASTMADMLNQAGDVLVCFSALPDGMRADLPS